MVRFLPFLALVLVFAGGEPVRGEVRFEASVAVIETDRGRFPFSVELAVTPEQRARGLMHRAKVPPGTGMLFDFGRPTGVVMWMADTPVSLDMLFLDEAGRVVGVAHDTAPYSRAAIPSPAPARGVLEVAAGTARRLGIAPGDRVLHDMFGTPP